MKKNGHIFILMVLFVGVVSLLDTIDLWHHIGVDHPHGLYFQGFLFFVLYAVLKTFLFEPYLQVLDERDAQTIGKSKAAEETREKSQAMLLQYQAAIDKARLTAIRERERVAMEAESVEKEKLQKAKMQGLKHLEERAQENLKNAAQIKESLSGEVKNWSEDIVRKVSAGTVMATPRERIAATGS